MLGAGRAVARSVTGVSFQTQPATSNARYRPTSSGTCTMLPFSSVQKCSFGSTNHHCRSSSGRCIVRASSTSNCVCFVAGSATAQSGSGSHSAYHRAARSSDLLPAPAQHAALRRSICGSKRRPKVQTAALEGEGAGLVPLGLDFLTFLAATVLVIPLFKSVKASPVLGFLFSGIVLGQLG